MDIEKLAIEAGVIVVEENYTYWADNNAIEVLDNFARLLRNYVLPYVREKDTGKLLSSQEILDEVNRDRSEGWDEYTLDDLYKDPRIIELWLDHDYYLISWTK